MTRAPEDVHKSFPHLPAVPVFILSRAQLKVQHATSHGAILIQWHTSLEEAPALIYDLRARLRLYNFLASRNFVLLELYILRRNPPKLVANLHPSFIMNYKIM